MNTFLTTIRKSEEREGFGVGLVATLPKSASEKLPSKGMTMVKATMNDVPFQVALEPDGKGSHWFRLSDAVLTAIKVGPGDAVKMTVESTKEWPEPKVPVDLQKALNADSKAQAVWKDITPMARWDWIRWVGAAKLVPTRHRRVEVACSKLALGTRRPCCFNRTQCTLTEA